MTGGVPQVEYKVDIPPGGSKKSRFADVIWREPDGSQTLFNVARQTVSGIFVARERKALADFIRANQWIILVPP